MINSSKASNNAMTIMRVLIGWHFLFEGVVKFSNPAWTSKGYLLSAEMFKPFFQWLASDGMIGIADYGNIFILIFVGLTLVLGYMERPGAIVGIIILLMYYIAHPALPGYAQTGAEGSYWIINKNLIEAAALLVIYFNPTSSYFGIGRFSKSSSNL